MDTMDTMGRHVIAELWDCDFDKLNDMPYIEQLFVDAALRAGAEVREVAFHKFAPQGVSGVVIISESHLTIHSFPGAVTQVLMFILVGIVLIQMLLQNILQKV